MQIKSLSSSPRWPLSSNKNPSFSHDALVHIVVPVMNLMQDKAEYAKAAKAIINPASSISCPHYVQGFKISTTLLKLRLLPVVTRCPIKAIPSRRSIRIWERIRSGLKYTLGTLQCPNSLLNASSSRQCSSHICTSLSQQRNAHSVLSLCEYLVTITMHSNIGMM
jgi:hypothetical protein